MQLKPVPPLLEPHYVPSGLIVPALKINSRNKKKPLPSYKHCQTLIKLSTSFEVVASGRVGGGAWNV